MLKTAYFGSPWFSAYFLEKIISDSDLKKKIKVNLVITQNDQPSGRNRLLTPTPVKQTAKKFDLQVLEVKNSKLEIKDYDLCLVFAFGKIIPPSLLYQPKIGFWNLHPSLLPKYRGPSPIAYPLILGDKETGVTLFQMDEKIDHGLIIAQEKINIDNFDLRPDLEKKLTDLGFILFKKTIINYHQLKLKKQEDELATFTRFLKKKDGFIPFSVLKKAIYNQSLQYEEVPLIIKEYWEKYSATGDKSPLTKNKKNFNSSLLLFNLFRGLSPWPGLWTILPNGKRLKINKLHLTKNHQLQLVLVQLEGKKEVNFVTFNRAYRIF